MIFGKKVKPNKRTTLVPESGMHAVGFYVDVSSFVEDDEINFYLEMSKEDLTISTDDGTELITPLTLAHFTKDLGIDQRTNICDSNLYSKVVHKSSISSSENDYIQYNYTVVCNDEKYLFVTVRTYSEGGFKNNVYFYLEGDGISTTTVIIIIIVFVVLVVIVGVIINLCKKRKQNQMNNNFKVNNQVITPTDNQGNVQYGNVVTYSSQGYASGK